ncbi:hypothetical protein RGUI_2750 [Rhodovulum sp. P5]|uniref:gp16 family protein n=1 Tax=Rhodovulum sp. P5 TaxID=1564506 RepID=UPI0009C245AF|nr:regulatory protein GemA [Rhodovulum sp. P5]ARE40891.1 hypothetical protein RGUI_2750 [Rhodovulum sp. P5]
MNSKAVINIAKGQLGLDEDTYRALLARVTGKDSLRAMTDAEHRAVIAEMKRLGFRLRSGGKSIPPSVKPYIRLLHALWKSCHRLGAIEDGSRPALRAFCKRFVAYGVDDVAVDPDLLSYDQAHPIIEALKKMEARAKAAQEG